MSELSVLVGPAPSKAIVDFFPPGTEIKAGDTKLIWDSTKTVEVDAARSTFDKLKASGYTAFRAEGKDGHQGGKMEFFDPSAERIIMIPVVKGGSWTV